MMTVQNCTEQLDLNRDTHSSRRKMQNYLHQAQAAAASSTSYPRWKNSERNVHEKQKEQPEQTSYYSGKALPQIEQEEALNMTTDYRQNKTETAISAFREISAMEYMKNAVQQLQEKVQASGTPFPLRDQQNRITERKIKGIKFSA